MAHLASSSGFVYAEVARHLIIVRDGNQEKGKFDAAARPRRQRVRVLKFALNTAARYIHDVSSPFFSVNCHEKFRTFMLMLVRV